MTLGRQAMEVTLMVSAPMLIVVLVIGLLVSIFQAATQINEATLSFIPKVLGLALTLLLAGGWMLQTLVEFTHRLIEGIPSAIH